MLLLRLGLFCLEGRWLGGLDVGLEVGKRMLLARVLGTLRPSRVLPGPVRNTLLIESWL